MSSRSNRPGEPGRHFDLEGRPGVSPFWRVLNSGKTVITLDLKSDEGRQGLSALIARADVLLESYRPGVSIGSASATRCCGS